jgi:hypothetical protein
MLGQESLNKDKNNWNKIEVITKEEKKAALK